MLNAAVASAIEIGTPDSFDPWESVRLRPQADIVADLKRSRCDLLARFKSTKNTTERIFGPESVASSFVGEPSGKSGVRIF